MTYERKFPLCPYKEIGGRRCFRKRHEGHCIYSNKPKKCEHFNEWVDGKKFAEDGSESLQALFKKEDGYEKLIH